MIDLRTYYLGIHHNVLEPISLNFSTFGALWYEEDKQQEQDWRTRFRLAWKAAFSEPWRSMDDGWYVLRSRNRFPYHLSIVHK